MSRIRSIKPEYWTDEKIVQLPFEARLLFIGMWNFADDDGYLPDEPERIRLQILPSDQIDAEGLVDLLVACGLLERFFISDGGFLRVKGFEAHQKISHKTPTKFNIGAAKKQAIPAGARREIAQKYGCVPGKTKDVNCYFCGAAGQIVWWPLRNGRPSAWVAFSGVEIDHYEPEFTGGETSAENLVLSCRYCNRSRGAKSAGEFIERKYQIIPENTGEFRPEGKGREGKGIEIEKKTILSEIEPELFQKPEPCSRKPKAYTVDFEENFWKPYPTDGLMSKKDTFTQWVKLSSEDKLAASRSISGFKSHCQANPTYRPVHACRYLSQRRFDGFANVVPINGHDPPKLTELEQFEARMAQAQASGEIPGAGFMAKLEKLRSENRERRSN